MDLLQAIVREQKLTAICTLHQLELAKQYGDRIISLKDSKIQQKGFDVKKIISLHSLSKISSFLLFKKL